MVFPATLTSLSRLAEWLTQQLAPLPVSDEWRFSVDLAACETATNIIRHALHEDGHSQFSVEFIQSEEAITLRFTDTGDPFPATRLAAAKEDSTFGADPFAESGRGLKLVLLSVDLFKVENTGGMNVTTLEKLMPGQCSR
ncbi:ATP-binding protein [Yokenella regensburgei]|uniref:ATP-binding protein n=1 Tax=Yokenella regensburgei TaxID=158877 RepID=UPI003F190CAA